MDILCIASSDDTGAPLDGASAELASSAGASGKVRGLPSIKEEESPEQSPERADADERCEDDAPPASTAVDPADLCESVQVLYHGLREAYDHCAENACQVKALSKRMDSMVDKMNSFEGYVAQQLRLCLDLEGEHFRNVSISVGEMCLKEREAQNQGLEEVRKDLAEEKEQALLKAEERDLASRRKFAELTAGEVRWLVEMTNDKFMEVQQDVECLRRQLASCTSQTPRCPEGALICNSNIFGPGGLLSNSALANPSGSEPMLSVAPPCPALSTSVSKHVASLEEASSAQTGQLSARGAAPAGPRTSRGIRPMAKILLEAHPDDVPAEGVKLPSRPLKQGLASKPPSLEKAPKLVADSPSSNDLVEGISWV